jgi:hypothetical protein
MGHRVKLRLHMLGIEAIGVAKHGDHVAPRINPYERNALFGEPIHNVEGKASTPVQYHDAGRQIRCSRKEASFLQRLRVVREATAPGIPGFADRVAQPRTVPELARSRQFELKKSRASTCSVMANYARGRSPTKTRCRPATSAVNKQLTAPRLYTQPERAAFKPADVGNIELREYISRWNSSSWGKRRYDGRVRKCALILSR